MADRCTVHEAQADGLPGVLAGVPEDLLEVVGVAVAAGLEDLAVVAEDEGGVGVRGDVVDVPLDGAYLDGAPLRGVPAGAIAHDLELDG